MKALLIGGAGSTGMHLIEGLRHRGYSVSMLNRGSRPDSFIPPDVERIRADPHFAETFKPAVAGRKFDLVIATYGRLRMIAEAMAGITGRLITVGGMPVYSGFATPRRRMPNGMPIPTPETHDPVGSSEEHAFGRKIALTEQAILSRHGPDLSVTHFRYPLIYGTRLLTPNKIWWFAQRALDGRTTVALPEAGLSVYSRGYAANMAHAVLLAVDHPSVAAGQVYNCADERQFSLAQWGQIIFDEFGAAMSVLSIPDAAASHARELQLFRDESFHRVLSIAKIREQLGYRDQTAPEEALRRTVRELAETPPEQAVVDELRARYPLEDALIELQSQANARMAELDHVDPEYRHAYAHPKTPGAARDHLGR